MRVVTRSAPLLLVLGVALTGCKPSDNPRPASTAPVTAAPDEVVLEVPGMH